LFAAMSWARWRAIATRAPSICRDARPPADRCWLCRANICDSGPVSDAAGGRGAVVAVGVGVAGTGVGGTGVAVGGTGVGVGGIGVAVGGTGVAVGGTGVAVGGRGVAVAGTNVAVGGTGVAVGGTAVAVRAGVSRPAVLVVVGTKAAPAAAVGSMGARGGAAVAVGTGCWTAVSKPEGGGSLRALAAIELARARTPAATRTRPILCGFVVGLPALRAVASVSWA